MLLRKDTVVLLRCVFGSAHVFVVLGDNEGGSYNFKRQQRYHVMEPEKKAEPSLRIRPNEKKEYKDRFWGCCLFNTSFALFTDASSTGNHVNRKTMADRKASRAFTNPLDYPSLMHRQELHRRLRAGENMDIPWADIMARLPDSPTCCHCLAFRFFYMTNLKFVLAEAGDELFMRPMSYT